MGKISSNIFNRKSEFISVTSIVPTSHQLGNIDRTCQFYTEAKLRFAITTTQVQKYVVNITRGEDGNFEELKKVAKIVSSYGRTRRL